MEWPSAMRLSPHRVLAVTVLFVTLFAPRLWAAWSHDSNVNLTIAPAAGTEYFPVMASDGAGGFFTAWEDGRNGTVDIYLQRITATGSVAPGWPAGGLAACVQPNAQTQPVVASDGVGGVFVAWADARTSPSDRDIYMSHVQANGTLATGWGSNGKLIPGLAGKDEYDVQIAADGSGGAFAAWTLIYTFNVDNDVYAAHVTGAGTILFSTGVDAPTNFQQNPSIISDGSGNAIIADINNDYGGPPGGWGLHYLKINPSNGSWMVSPVHVDSPALTVFISPALVGDGAGGAFMTYLGGSFDNLYLQHLAANGVVAPGAWLSSSLTLTLETSNNKVRPPFMVSDGAGGVLVAWSIFNNPFYSSYVRRILGTGYTAGGWPNTGRLIGSNDNLTGLVGDGAGGAVAGTYYQDFSLSQMSATRVTSTSGIAWYSPLMTAGTPAGGFAGLSDGSGGMLAAFSILRTSPAQVMAQNVDAFGALGDARPAITKVSDAPADQGGNLSVQWTASYLDAQPWRTIANYSIWRRVPGGTIMARAGKSATAAASVAPRRITTIERDQVVYWEYLTSEPARMLPGYSAVVPTVSDSGATNARTSVMIMAESYGGQSFWASAPDSGYSVDNLPPPQPAPFMGTYAAGTSSLSWGAVSVSDLAAYKLYRGGTSSFVVSPATLVASISTSQTTYSDAAGGPYWYRVSAVDTHGNESASTAMLPSGTTAVGDPPRSYALGFSPPAPNPTAGPLSFRFELAATGAVRLRVYDVRGRRVRELASGTLPAGDHSVTWDLRDDLGRRVGVGFYVARLETEGRALTRRVLVVK